MRDHEDAIAKELNKKHESFWRNREAREEEAFHRLSLLEQALAYFIGIGLSLIMLIPTLTP